MANSGAVYSRRAKIFRLRAELASLRDKVPEAPLSKRAKLIREIEQLEAEDRSVN